MTKARELLSHDDQLKLRNAEIMRLFFVEGKDATEIAPMFGMTRWAVATVIRHARDEWECPRLLDCQEPILSEEDITPKTYTLKSLGRDIAQLLQVEKENLLHLQALKFKI